MTMKYRIDRRAALGPARRLAASVLVPVPGARVHAQTLDKVSYQTNWRAQAEHGGFYLRASPTASTRSTASTATSAWAGRSRTRRSSCSAAAST